MPRLELLAPPPHVGDAGGVQTSIGSLRSALVQRAPDGWDVAFNRSVASLVRSIRNHAQILRHAPPLSNAAAELAAIAVRRTTGTGALTRALGTLDKACRATADLALAPSVWSAQYPLASRTRLITLPNDFQHRHFPEFFDEAELQSREHLFGRAIRRSSLVLAGSAQTLEDIHRFHPDATQKTALWIFPAPADLRPALNAEVSAAATLLASSAAQSFKILYPAQFWPHKNHRTLLRAIRELPRSDERGVMLVFTGVGKARADAERLAQSLLPPHKAIFVGNVPRGVLFGLYTLADLVAVPSLFEQASYPLIEAGFFGTPILCSDIPALRDEVSGHPRAVVGRKDVRGWRNAIAAAMQSADVRAELTQAADHVLRRHDVSEASGAFWQLALDAHAG